MHTRAIAVVLGVVAVALLLAAPALTVEPTTQPAKSLLEQIHEEAVKARTWAKWGCILAGLALLGVLWITRLMQTLAKNQIDLARMIKAGREQ